MDRGESSSKAHTAPGHLIHSADNYRGSFRGSGAELRTNDYGAVRAGAGLLISSYKISHSAASREAAGENSAANSMLKQTLKMADSFSAAATTHATVAFGSHLGATHQETSVIDDKAAPLKALWTMSAGMLSKDSVDAARADAAARSVDGDGKLPHVSGPMIAIAAKAGLGMVAGQDVQLSNGETVVLMSGADTQFINGGQMRVHSGQAIGVLAGAVQAGEGGVGLQFIAGKGAIDYQAQSDELKVQARDEIKVVSANAHVDWAAAKSISLSTAGGANITIEGGNITVQCPGKITIHAGMKKFSGPTNLGYDMNRWPGTLPFDEEIVVRWPYDQSPVPNRRFEIVRGDGSIVRGITDGNGATGLQKSQFVENLVFRLLPEK